jgi:outer membrane protein assembly factor BamA
MNHLSFRFIVLFIMLAFFAAAQSDTISKPVKKEKIKKGWTFGALPVVAYDSDMGFQYGALAQFFDYGDGTIYPEYRHTFYVEVSRFTKGSGVNQLFYDSKYLIPGHIRITADLDYLTERALDFYGFNGYEANYVPSVTEQEYSANYISRVYYKHERMMLRAMADFQGRIIGEKFRWLAGLNYFNIKTATVDIDRMNKGKKKSKQLPDTSLYHEYVKYGLIGEDEKDGGSHLILKLGLIYDTRDNEAAPDKGIWSELLLMVAPDFLSNTSGGFTLLTATHRQFFTMVPKKLVLAYRLSYQGTIMGKTPFYMLPYLFSSFALTTKPDGLGGSRTIRGVLRNRVVGDGTVNGNIELRWKFWKTYLFRQNFYLGLTGFFDAGMVVQDRFVDQDAIDNKTFYFDSRNDRPHFGTGLGIRAALNENFIIAVDYGFALDKRDGTSGLYIGISNIF